MAIGLLLFAIAAEMDAEMWEQVGVADYDSLAGAPRHRDPSIHGAIAPEFMARVVILFGASLQPSELGEARRSGVDIDAR